MRGSPWTKWNQPHSEKLSLDSAWPLPTEPSSNHLVQPIPSAFWPEAEAAEPASLDAHNSISPVQQKFHPIESTCE